VWYEFFSLKVDIKIFPPLGLGILYGLILSAFGCFLLFLFFCLSLVIGLLSGLDLTDLTHPLASELFQKLEAYAVVVIPFGFMAGLGIGYGYRPQDEKAGPVIGLFATSVALAAIFYFLNRVPGPWSEANVIYLIALSMPYGVMLATIGMSARKQIIDKAKETTTDKDSD